LFSELGSSSPAALTLRRTAQQSVSKGEGVSSVHWILLRDARFAGSSG